MDKEWFESWFDTSYYHLLYKHRDDSEARLFLNNLLEFLKLKKNAEVLDVACGKGRHSIYLHSLGMKVTGIDLSVASIECASKSASEGLKFEVWDMRKKYADSRYDAVLNMFSSFGYFDEPSDDLKALETLKAAVKDEGFVVIDFINPEFAVRNLKKREIIDRGEIQFHITKELKNGFIYKHIDFLDNGVSHSYQEKLKMIKPEQFMRLFEETGLLAVNLCGDYNLGKFDAATSPRQIWILKKI